MRAGLEKLPPTSTSNALAALLASIGILGE